MKSRTVPLPWLFFSIAFLFAMLAWLWSVYGAVSKLELQLTDPSASQHINARSEQRQQILSFETRLARVLGASVESKLRTLENSVERGPLNADELRLIESTANELRLLQSNPAALAAAGSAVDVKDHPRYQALAANEPASQSAALVREIADLRKFFYASLIGFALFGLMAAGLWFNARRRHRLIEASVRHRLPLIKSLVEDRER